MSSIAVAWKPVVAKTSHATSSSWRRRCSAGSRIAIGVTLPVSRSAAALQGHLVAVGDTEVVAPLRVDLRRLVGAEGKLGRGRVLAHLVGGHARGQHGGEAVDGENAGHRGLPDRAAGLGAVQETEGVGLVEEVEEIFALAVGAVVITLERGVTRDLAREHVGRVGDAGDQTDAPLGDGRLGREGSPRLLLEEIEHGLERDDRPVTQRVEALVDPADGGPERDAKLAYLALGAELRQLVPQGVVADGLDADVVELQQVDVVTAQASQRRLDLRSHRLGPPVLRALGVPGGDPRRVDVVADLRGDDDVVAPSEDLDRKSTRLNSSHQISSYAVFCLKKKKKTKTLLLFEKKKKKKKKIKKT